MGHKPGCIWSDDEEQRKKGMFHRTPIDCCTVEDLQKELAAKDAKIKAMESKMQKMAMQLYDLSEEDYY